MKVWRCSFLHQRRELQLSTSENLNINFTSTFAFLVVSLLKFLSSHFLLCCAEFTVAIPVFSEFFRMHVVFLYSCIFLWFRKALYFNLKFSQKNLPSNSDFSKGCFLETDGWYNTKFSGSFVKSVWNWHADLTLNLQKYTCIFLLSTREKRKKICAIFLLKPPSTLRL